MGFTISVSIRVHFRSERISDRISWSLLSVSLCPSFRSAAAKCRSGVNGEMAGGSDRLKCSDKIDPVALLCQRNIGGCPRGL